MGLPTLALFPPPTPNGRLHIGHMAGPFLRADLYQRLARAVGDPDVLSLGHIDTYQSYVPKKAAELGVSSEYFLKRAVEQIQEDLRTFEVRYDLLIDNRSPRYRAFLAEAVAYFLADMDLHNVTLPSCGSCGLMLYESNLRGNCPRCLHDCYENLCENCSVPARRDTMLEPHCAVCQGQSFVDDGPARFARRTWIDADVVADVFDRIKSVATERIVAMHSHLGAHSLPLFYDSDYGFPVEGYGCLNPWVEVHFAQLYSCFTAYGLNTAQPFADLLADARALGPTRIVPFFGVDNSYLFGFLYPWISIRLGLENFLPVAMQCSHFLLRNGSKLSSSRNNAVWAHDLVEELGPRRARSALAASCPEGNNRSFDPSGSLTAAYEGGRGDRGSGVYASVTVLRERVARCADPQTFSVSEIADIVAKANAYAERMRRLDRNDESIAILTEINDLVDRLAL